MKNKTPKNKQWIVAICNDSFNYEPSLELISACKKAGIKGYRKRSTAQKYCDNANSI